MICHAYLTTELRFKTVLWILNSVPIIWVSVPNRTEPRKSTSADEGILAVGCCCRSQQVAVDVTVHSWSLTVAVCFPLLSLQVVTYRTWLISPVCVLCLLCIVRSDSLPIRIWFKSILDNCWTFRSISLLHKYI